MMKPLEKAEDPLMGHLSALGFAARATPWEDRRVPSATLAEGIMNDQTIQISFFFSGARWRLLKDDIATDTKGAI